MLIDRFTCTRTNVTSTAAQGFPRRVVPDRIQRSNGPKRADD